MTFRERKICEEMIIESIMDLVAKLEAKYKVEIIYNLDEIKFL